MNLKSYVGPLVCDLRRNCSGSFCLLLVCVFFPFGHKVEAASLMHVRDGGVGLYKLETERSDPGSATVQHDVALSTGEKAVLSVDFPNGMDWRLGQSSKLMLETFTYSGPLMEINPVRIAWKRRELQEAVIASESETSAWTARLERGEVHITGLRSLAGSTHTLVTREARINLNSAAVMIRRNDKEGTVIHVYDGNVVLVTTGGQSVSGGFGTQIIINPRGEISRSILQHGELAWMPSGIVLPVAAFPRMSLDVTLISPSS